MDVCDHRSARKALACALALLALFFSGCTVHSRLIVLVAGGDKGFYYQNLIEGATLAARESGYNAEVYVLGRDGDMEQLLAQAAENGADCIALAVPREDLPKNYVDGPPLVLMGEDMLGNWVACRVLGEETTIGKRTGQLVANKIGVQKSVIVVGDTINYSLDDDWEVALRGELGAQGSRVLARVNSKGDADMAYAQCKAVLQANTGIGAIVCRSQGATEGAMRAVRELALSMPIVGADFSDEIALGLRDGVISVSVVRNAYAYGFIGMDSALRIVSRSGASERRQLDAVYVSAGNMFDEEMQAFLYDV